MIRWDAAVLAHGAPSRRRARAAAALVRECSLEDAGTAYLIYLPDLAGPAPTELVRELTGCAVELGEWRLVLVSGQGDGGAQPVRAGGDTAGTGMRTQSDPVVSRALQLLHEDPAHRWSVAELAHRTAVSRASLARRFTAVVGQAPMTYLTGWRISLAADLLRDTDGTVESIARRVGYASAFALSVAFKRVRGLSPTAHRRSAAAGTALSAELPTATA